MASKRVCQQLRQINQCSSGQNGSQAQEPHTKEEASIMLIWTPAHFLVQKANARPYQYSYPNALQLFQRKEIIK